MNKSDLKRKNRLVIIGGARGAGKFSVLNEIIENTEGFEVINTGKEILQISKNFGFNSLDDVRLMDYYRFIEPALLEKIKTCLKITNVAIETHYHYTTPGLTTNSMRDLASLAKEAVLVLVDTEPKEIFLKNKESGLEWFKDIKNIEKDVLANKDYFKVYGEVMKEKTQVKTIIANPNTFNIKEIINYL